MKQFSFDFNHSALHLMAHGPCLDELGRQIYGEQSSGSLRAQTMSVGA
jgi:hypothetical protein